MTTMSDNSKTITIKEVAKESGVSIKTVSRVINKLPYVNEYTRERVWKVIEKLSYIPNPEGRKLASFKKKINYRTGNIGCIMFPGYNKYYEFFFAELLDELDRVFIELSLHKYFLYTLKDIEDQSLFLKMVNPNMIDGCVLIGIGDNYKDEILKIKQRIPNVVILSNYIDDKSISCVYPDGFKEGYLATKHLISFGHKKIACITGYFDRPGYSQDRLNGYKKALRDSGIEYDENIVREGKYSIDGAISATESLLQNGQLPTAVFVVSDPMAIGVYNAIQNKGFNIPKDISVASCGNIQLSNYIYPSLTSVGTISKYELVKATVKTLLEEIDTKREIGIRTVFPVELIERESCKRI